MKLSLENKKYKYEAHPLGDRNHSLKQLSLKIRRFPQRNQH